MTETTTMVPTEHQQERLEQAIDKLVENGRLVRNARLVFKGDAGVGKTFVCKSLVEQLMGTFYGGIYCSAPTNDAVGVLKSKVNIDSPRITFNTIHSALNIRMRIDNKLQKKVFEPVVNEKNPALAGIRLWVIDEASMIGLNMLLWIEQYASKNGVTVIFVGDDKQIQPVGEADSVVFMGRPILVGDTYEFMPYPEIVLTEIVRQGQNNPVIALSRSIKDIWKYDTVVNGDCGYVYTYERDQVVRELAKVNGTDDLKYLAWTNDEVNAINRDVRQYIYGDSPAKIEEGETLVFQEPYGEEYYTSQRIKVERVHIAELTFKAALIKTRGENQIYAYKLKVYIINGNQTEDVFSGLPRWKGVFVIHEDSEKTYNQIVSIMRSNMNKNLLRYSDLVNFQDNFALLNYNHAKTVHKSQGQTYRRAILNISNICINSDLKERQRLLYTGITRVSELLILYNA